MGVYKRGDVWYIDLPYLGKRIRRRTEAKTKREAQRMYSEFETRLMSGDDSLLHRDVKLSEIRKRYIEVSHDTKKASSVERIIHCLKIVFNAFPGLEDQGSAAINANMFDEYIRKRRKKVKPATINAELRTVKAMLNWAVERGIIGRNPVAKYRLLKGVVAKDVRYLNPTEVRSFLDAATQTYFPIFLTFVKTGMRKAELINLRWRDVDFKTQQICVTGEGRASGEFTPKTYRTRYIPMDDALADMLKNRRHGRKPEDLVFQTQDDDARNNNMRRQCMLTAKRAGLGHLTLHHLRHTYASSLVREGVPLAVVKELLGHRSITTTMIYTHLDDEQKRDAVRKLPY